jgi:hypothetical protein
MKNVELTYCLIADCNYYKNMVTNGNRQLMVILQNLWSN